MLERMRLVASMGKQTHPLMATWGTLVCALIILPLLDAFFYVCFGLHVHDGDLFEAIAAAVITATLISALNGSAQAVVKDYHLGIFLPIISTNPFNLTYWLLAMSVPATLACLPQILCLMLGWAGASFIGVSLSVSSVLLLCLLLMIAAAMGGILGALIAAASVSLSNPYLISNILVAFIPLLMGTIVPLSVYPPMLQYLTYVIPGSMLVEAGRHLAISASGLLWALVYSVVVCGVWAAVLSVLCFITLHRLKKGELQGML